MGIILYELIKCQKLRYAFYLIVIPLTLIACQKKDSHESGDKNEVPRFQLQDHHYSEEAQVVIDSLRLQYTDSTELSDVARNIGWPYFHSGEWNKADEFFRFGVEVSPDNLRSLAAYAENSALLQQLDYSEAIYQKILSLDSTYEAAYGSLATLYLFQGKKDKAKTYVDQLLESDNPFVKRAAYTTAGVLALYNEDNDRAIGHLKERLAITSEIWDVERHFLDHPYWDMHLIGNVYMDSGRPDEAKEWYDKGMRVADSTLTEGRPLRSIKSDYMFFSKGDFEIEKNNLDQAFKFSKENGNAVFYLARIFTKRDLPDSAISILKKFKRKIYVKEYLLGDAYQNKGDNAMARQLFEEVLNYHQVGNRFWQYEYALVSNKAKQGLEQIQNK